MPIADYQVFIALFLALATGVFAVRLGVALYKQKNTIFLQPSESINIFNPLDSRSRYRPGASLLL